MRPIADAKRLHDHGFARIERLADAGLAGLAARLVFLAVLFLYFLNSWTTKLGEGALGFLRPADGAYYQIVPWAVEAAGGDVAQVGLFDTAIVHAGTWAEFLLPVLIVIGLFARLAAAGMMGFVAVQSFVDIRFHGVDAQTIGAWFDRHSDSLIADQRLLWGLALFVVMAKGAGYLSLDRLLSRPHP
jgi:putative oxidoreductase